ncbi:carboxylesterase/lipase family protein [Paraburkholderia sp. J67]|uniref:carboxylesterase/lipase family protein n=1 Tax=Paraburkholderia sp. J67 TaxID=2805435 RepID=UPI002ABDB6F3|nr:carboxylesterase family protein [Paraburkholderia sp. J67]
MPDSRSAPSSAAYSVTVDGGTVAGIVDTDRALIEYRAIPFAAPPVGELRWRPPQPVVPWHGTRVCDRFAPMCAQPARPERSIFLEYAGEQATSEDCLYLNVFAPLDRPAGKLPVMVWIHGGAFQVGSSTNATFVRGDLTRQDVILVTINYRVNAFGFLSHPELTAESEHEASGNYGLMDQIAALAWVRRNIGAFGGDAESVTVFGQSAGGASIANLMASPLAKGLFDRAIVQSVAFMPMMPLAQAEQQGIGFMKRAGATSIAELRSRPASQIVGLSKATQPLIWPSVDGYVMQESAEAVFAAQRQMRVPMLTGWTRDEGTVFPAFEEAGALREALRTRFGSRVAQALTHYPAADDTQARHSARRINGDALAGAGVWQAACAHAQGGNSVWLYHFEHEQPFFAGQAYAESDPAAALGVFHSADYPYVFGTLKELTRAWSTADFAVGDLMQRYWVSFARNGDPNVAGLPAWSRFDANADATMRLRETPCMDTIPRLEALRFLVGENMIGNFL